MTESRIARRCRAIRRDSDNPACACRRRSLSSVPAPYTVFTCPRSISLASTSTCYPSHRLRVISGRHGQGRVRRPDCPSHWHLDGRDWQTRDLTAIRVRPSQVDRDRPGCIDCSTRKACAARRRARARPGFGLEPWQRTVARSTRVGWPGSARGQAELGPSLRFMDSVSSPQSRWAGQR